MYTLELSINPYSWRIFSGRRQDPAFAALRDRVFQRDRYTCQFCGFQAKEYQEILNINGDYRNHQIENLATACPFCAQAAHLTAVGTGYGGGKLVFLPEMTQAELNSFCHVIFCSMTNRTPHMDTSQAIYRNLRMRSSPIEQKFGPGTSTPSTFCELLLNTGQFDAKKHRSLLKDIRVLPSFSRFRQELEDWAKAAAEELSKN